MLELRKVSKSYGQGGAEVHALREVSLTAGEGAMVAVMGPSGSGKSTLLTIAGTLERPTSGEVLIAGEAVSRASRGAKARLRRRVIGYVFQDFNLLPGLTAAENVSLPLELDGVSCIASPPIQQVSQLPSGTSAPNTVVTEHAITTLHLQDSVQTAGWLITVPGGLTAAQVTAAQQVAAGTPGMSVETRNSIPSLAQVIDAAAFFGIALAFTGAVIGITGGYLAAIGFFQSNSLDGLSSLASIPVASLLVIVVGMPLAATVLGWLLAGRDPAGIAGQPVE